MSLIRNRYQLEKFIRRIEEKLTREPGRKGIRDSHRYYTNMLRATPTWLSDVHWAEIRRVYRAARRLGLSIDHIVPLASPLVCGLHVPWNLQPLSFAENSKKTNKYWPDCPFEQAGFAFEAQITFPF